MENKKTSNLVEITIATTSDASDLIANVFFENGFEAVSIIDKQDIIDIYNRKETWDYVSSDIFNIDDKIVYVKSGTDKKFLPDLLPIIREQLEQLKLYSPFDLGSLEITTCDIENEDWRYVWKKFYKPIKSGNFVIVPNWIKYEKTENEKIVLIEPGMAFGTGDHETTRLALKLLSDVDLNNKTILDVGTGSGILGIAGVKANAKISYMFDIDKTAVITAKKNIELNNVSDKTVVKCADLFTEDLPKIDVVVANITADVLSILAKNMKKVVNNDTIIILSGILEKYEKKVVDAYFDIGYSVTNKVQEGEWIGLKLEVKNGN